MTDSTPIGMLAQRRHHCWECLHRRLVCDSTRPGCTRCSTSGISCPGYTSKKPPRLRWLEPGIVLSRRKPAKSGQLDTDESERLDDPTQTHLQQVRKARTAFFSRSCFLTSNCAIFQAAEYYLVPITELAPNPAIHLATPRAVQDGIAYPDHIRLSFVCMILGHRINRLRLSLDPSSNHLALTFYSYRSLVIRSLNEDISIDHKRTGNLVVTGIIALLLMDLQQGVFPDWRCHLEGVHQVILLRGGLRSIANNPGIEPLLLCSLLLAVMGNTTSPASDISMAQSHFDNLDFINATYGNNLFAFQIWPASLFALIIRVTHLRSQIVRQGVNEFQSHSAKADSLLEEIHQFSPEEWARSKPACHEDWSLMGTILRAAVTIYCVSSLQSLSVLSSTKLLKNLRRACSDTLKHSLEKAFFSPRIKRYLTWPLVMLGVEAVTDGWALQTFVENWLANISHEVGSSVPLRARDVLQKFWSSGETRWDACFDKPYLLVTQTAVDMSGGSY